MAEEKFECPQCGNILGSEDLLKEHVKLEHGSSSHQENTREKSQVFDKLSHLRNFRPESRKSFTAGLVVGMLVTGIAFSGFLYWSSLDHRVTVPVTVVTCDNCSYDEFQDATDRMFKARYQEVDYQSEEGQQLIEKYDISYVPAFIFDKKIERAEYFEKVESALVKFEDAYLIPHKRARTAQRLSEGRALEQ